MILFILFFRYNIYLSVHVVILIKMYGDIMYHCHGIIYIILKF